MNIVFKDALFANYQYVNIVVNKIIMVKIIY